MTAGDSGQIHIDKYNISFQVSAVRAFDDGRSCIITSPRKDISRIESSLLQVLCPGSLCSYKTFPSSSRTYFLVMFLSKVLEIFVACSDHRTRESIW